jgi:hypothetical protein
MKKTFLFILSGLFCFAVKSQNVVVGADKSFTSSLNDYSTYAWSENIDQIPSDAIYISPSGVYVFNNESVRSKIKNAIEYELSAKGYQKSENNSDMTVLFTITERPGTLKTYNGYQMINNGLDSVRTPESAQTTPIEAGTLIINIIDSKSGVVAWQGFASGILKPDMLQDDSRIRHAVASIFGKFDFRAKH